MNSIGRIVIGLGLVVAVGAVMILKRPAAPPGGPGAQPAAVASTTNPTQGGLPRLLDLGATQCIPCKAMAPILEELKTEHASKLRVDFIDVWQDPLAGQQYGIDGIPTQIFFDAAGKELYRHQGFMPKEDILAKWKELGVVLP